MSTDTTQARTSSAATDVKEMGAELASSAQEQLSTKAHALGEDVALQVREQLDQRSTQVGEQVQAIGQALQSGVDQLSGEGMDVPAKVVAQVARRAENLGGYLESAQADQILADLESFARRRPWLTAGAGVLAGFLASRFVKASADRRNEMRGNNGRSSTSRSPLSLPAGGS